jgi:hypothetical protein
MNAPDYGTPFLNSVYMAWSFPQWKNDKSHCEEIFPVEQLYVPSIPNGVSVFSLQFSGIKTLRSPRATRESTLSWSPSECVLTTPYGRSRISYPGHWSEPNTPLANSERTWQVGAYTCRQTETGSGGEEMMKMKTRMKTNTMPMSPLLMAPSHCSTIGEMPISYSFPVHCV